MFLKKYLPWRLSSKNQFLITYGDKILFKSITRTPPINTTPESEVSLHSAVPHRYVCAYILAIKSLLRYNENFCVYVHDDGSLTAEDVALLKSSILGVVVILRGYADDLFESKFSASILTKIRKSYTSYIKLFDPTFHSKKEKIIILDTDTLFLNYPQHIFDWIDNGKNPWHHAAPDEIMKVSSGKKSKSDSDDKPHVQTLILRDLDDINNELGKNYRFDQGFCSGFIGYHNGIFSFAELERLFNTLHARFQENIYRWGSEQTVHGLILCGAGSDVLPMEEYLVFTDNTASIADKATFVHFVGECRFNHMIYPKLGRKIIRELKL